ncbi:MAG: coenzyme F430 synthase [Methanoregulaceae archaeon]|nr:coenzyme F430 synthase [Methanoregulaceae archaeon]
MDLLVLDAIHGGRELAEALREKGHSVDIVDVYRNGGDISSAEASVRSYDLAIAPIHLDPGHPLLKGLSIPCVSHHEAVRWILGKDVPETVVEITGARGKTTTAHAVAHLMTGPGVLHTSTGTYRYPEKTLLWRKSITPASVIPAARKATEIGGWLIAEISLGFCGLGGIGIITSPDDYFVAAGTRSALSEKVRSASRCRHLLVVPGVVARYTWTVRVEDAVHCEGSLCRYDLDGRTGSFSSPLLGFAAYQTPLMLAAMCGCLLNAEPSVLERFPGVEGRMSVSRNVDRLIVDNSNSGTNTATTLEAVEYIDKDLFTLVIGEEAHAVCEGFPTDEIIRTIVKAKPSRVVLVGNARTALVVKAVQEMGIPVSLEERFLEAREKALEYPGSIVLAVKMWR